MTTTRRARRQFVEFRVGESSRLPRLPGLDGLRGLAVAGVVLFHAELGVMVGGYLGVSTFFTLSGFLITSLLLRECIDTGEVRLSAFWGRRFRRLLPASVVTLFLVTTVFAAFFATRDQLGGLRSGVLSALAQVANWHFILDGSSYGDLFAAPSPVLHFWSLAIEEQFYLVFPLILFGLWRAVKGRQVILAAVLSALALFSAVEPLIFTMSDDRIYFGTDTRAAELLLGAVLAIVLGNRSVRRNLLASGPARTAVLGLGGVCLAVQLYWWWTLEQSSPALYRGGFAGYAVMTCVVIAAASVPGATMTRGLTVAPLMWLGERSYGIYLLHWPIFLAIRQTWPDASSFVRVVPAIALSLLAAEVSFRLVETPFRQRRWPVAEHFGRWAVVGVTIVAVVAFTTLPSSVQNPVDELEFDNAANRLDSALEAQAAAPTTTAAPAVVPVPELATFGDSTALLMGIGMVQYAAETGTIFGQKGDAALGCGVSRFASRRVDTVFGYAAECEEWPTRWKAIIDQQTPDVVQLVTGAWETTDAKIPGSTEFSALGDPAVDAFVKSEILTAVDILGSSGALVLLVLWPAPSGFVSEGATEGVRNKSDPARWNRLYELFREVAQERGSNVRILDLAGYLGERADDPGMRPDGVHIREDIVKALYAEWVGAETIRLWSDFWRARDDPTTSTAEPAATQPPG